MAANNMTTPLPLASLVERLRNLEAKATPAPWEVDSEYDHDAHYSGGGGCGRGFKNVFVGAEIDGQWKTLLDTVNSDHKLIEEDYDEDGSNAWDSIGHANAELIAALRNALPEIATALEALAAENGALREALRDMLWAFVDSEDAAEARSIQRTDAETTARATLERTPQP